MALPVLITTCEEIRSCNSHLHNEKKVEKLKINNCPQIHQRIEVTKKTTALKSEVSQLCPTLQPHGLQPTRLLHPWNFLGKSTGVGCHFLLQGIFPIQGSNPGLLHCGQMLYCLSHRGIPSQPKRSGIFSISSIQKNLGGSLGWSWLRTKPIPGPLTRSEGATGTDPAGSLTHPEMGSPGGGSTERMSEVQLRGADIQAEQPGG